MKLKAISITSETDDFPSVSNISFKREFSNSILLHHFALATDKVVTVGIGSFRPSCKHQMMVAIGILGEHREKVGFVKTRGYPFVIKLLHNDRAAAHKKTMLCTLARKISHNIQNSGLGHQLPE